MNNKTNNKHGHQPQNRNRNVFINAAKEITEIQEHESPEKTSKNKVQWKNAFMNPARSHRNNHVIIQKQQIYNATKIGFVDENTESVENNRKRIEPDQQFNKNVKCEEDLVTIDL